jgi:O-antigen ligase
VLSFIRWPKPALLVFALYMLFADTVAYLLGYGVARLDELFVPAAVLISAIRQRPWRDRLHLLREGAVAALVVLAVASSLANGVAAHVWLPGLVLLVKVIAFLYVAAWQDWTREDIVALGVPVVGVGLVVIGLGYVEAINPAGFRAVLGVSDVGSARGMLPAVKSIFYHPVLYGWLAAYLGLFLFAFYVVYRRWWLLAGALFFSAAVMLSARRRAIIGLLAALAGGFASHVLRDRRWRPLARGWLPVAAGMLVLFAVFWSGIGDLIEQTQREYVAPTPTDPGAPVDEVAGMTTARELLYQGAVTVAIDHFPLGAGLGRYGSWMSRVEYSPLYRELGFDSVWGLRPDFPLFITDTFWPQILGEIGVFGVAAYLVFIGVVGYQLWRATKVVDDRLLLAFCLGALMVFGHALVETLASSMFHSPTRVYLLFGALGIALAVLDAHTGRRNGGEIGG